MTTHRGSTSLCSENRRLVRGGLYRETITFRRSDTAEHPITVRAYQHDKAIVTGCEPVTGWKRQGGNVWKAPMPWTLGRGRNQVFQDHEVMIEARFPSQPSPGLELPVAGLSALWPTFGPFSIPDPKRPDRILSKLLEGQPDDYSKGAMYYGVHWEGWSAQTGIVESSRSGELSVGNRTKTWWWLKDGSNIKSPELERGMLVGHMNALDQPGEWHWEHQTLYIMPFGSGEPRAVEAKKRQLAFDLSGQGHITIEGLIIKAASAGMQQSHHCRFEGCDFSYVSHFSFFDVAGQLDGVEIVHLDEVTSNVNMQCNLLWAAPGSLQRDWCFNTMAVGVTEIENVFFRHFVRTVAELRAEDFPGRKPFRFGHHFENPPPLPKWPRLETLALKAEACNRSSNAVIWAANRIENVTDGGWLAFEKVDFSPGWRSAVMRFASADKSANRDRVSRPLSRAKVSFMPPPRGEAADPLVLEATEYNEAVSG